MDKKDIVRIDGIKWWVSKTTSGVRQPVPLCPQHHLRLKPAPEAYRTNRGTYATRSDSTAKVLECAEEGHELRIPREYSDEQKYVLDRIDALVFQNMSVMNLDDEAIPVAEEELKEKDSPYWVRAKVTESKSGVRLIIWAGNKAKKNKVQLFVEPELKRLSFDQNDDHPTEVFARVEAIFANGIKSQITDQ
jgi:hypothetical protein